MALRKDGSRLLILHSKKGIMTRMNRSRTALGIVVGFAIAGACLPVLSYYIVEVKQLLALSNLFCLLSILIIGIMALFFTREFIKWPLIRLRWGGQNEFTSPITLFSTRLAGALLLGFGIAGIILTLVRMF